MRRFALLPIRCRVWIGFQLVSMASLGAALSFTTDARRTLPIIGFCFLGQIVSCVALFLASRQSTWLLRLLLLAAVYHSLIGPIFIAHYAMNRMTRNGDLALVLYPHVVSAIDAME